MFEGSLTPQRNAGRHLWREVHEFGREFGNNNIDRVGLVDGGHVLVASGWRQFFGLHFWNLSDDNAFGDLEQVVP